MTVRDFGSLEIDITFGGQGHAHFIGLTTDLWTQSCFLNKSFLATRINAVAEQNKTQKNGKSSQTVISQDRVKWTTGLLHHTYSRFYTIHERLRRKILEQRNCI